MLSKTKILLSALSAVFLLGCSEENNTFNTDITGKISLSLSTDLQIAATVDSRASADPSTDDRLSALAGLTSADFAITLEHSTPGVYSGNWNSHSDFPVEENFPIGNYTMTAAYGSQDSEGFDAPWVYGETTFIVKENATTQVDLSASVANSLVHVTFTDNFRNYFTAFSAGVRSTKGTLHYVGSAEERPVYVAPGNVDITADVTMPSGKTASLTMGSIEAKKGTLHSVTLDTKSSNETVTLVVTFSDDLTETVHEIDLSDDLEDAAAPVVTTDGFNGGDEIKFVESNEADGDNAYKYHVAARGGMQEVTLYVDNTPYNLLTESGQSQVSQMGVRLVGLEPGAMFGLVDLTGCFGSLKLSGSGEQSTTYRIEVKDTFGKTLSDNKENTDDNSLKVTLVPESLKLDSYSDMTAETFRLTVTSNINNLMDRLTLYADNDRGNGQAYWDKPSFTVESTVKGNDVPTTYTYTVLVETPASVLTFNLWGVTGKPTESNKLSVTRPIPEFYIGTLNGNNVFAKYVYLTVHPTLERESNLFATVAGDIELSLNNETKKVEKERIGNTDYFKVKFDNLTAKSEYEAKGVLNDYSTSFQFTTEEELQIPNSNFEQQGDIATGTLVLGGAWSVSSGNYYVNGCTFSYGIPSGWTTINGKTANMSHTSPNASSALYYSGTDSGLTGTRVASCLGGSNESSRNVFGNTWFITPSTFSVKDLQWNSEVPKIRVVNTGGNSGTPDAFKNFSAYTGDNAVVIRNVGWDPSGNIPNVEVKSGITYNHNDPTISYKAAGKLFLGSYSFNGVNDGVVSENYEEGLAFSSRPSSIKGYYYYQQDANDSNETGIVIVSLLNGTNVLATVSYPLEAQGNWSEFNVPITYPFGCEKATSIQVMFSSSNYCSYNQAEENSIATTNHFGALDAFNYGATLVIDDVELVY